MSFVTALRIYIVLLFIAAIAIAVVVPSTMRFDIGRKNVCRYFASTASTCLTFYRVPESIPFTLKRPSLSLERFHIPFTRSLEYVFGLDIRGGTEVTLVANMSDIPSSDRTRALEAAKEVLSRRINLYGLNESSVTTQVQPNSYRLIARIPEIKQADQVQALIGTTAQLDFREYKPASGSGAASPSGLPASSAGMLVSDFISTTLNGKDLARALALLDQTTGKPVISLEFSVEGKKKLAEITARNIGKPLAIFLDEYPISAPRVDSVITDGRAQIGGDFTLDNAKSLAATLNAGSLPVSISILSQKTLEATLGTDSIRHSVTALLIGVGLVFVFLLILYGWKGIIAIVVLFYYVLLTLVLYKLIPITLTLPGIAGFLLSIGMAVDTIVLVFERLREEERNTDLPTEKLLGRSFGRAWNSIKDANSVTILTALILANPFDVPWLVTSGMIRGFAFTLILGILLNLFTGMLVLRVVMRLFYRNQNTQRTQNNG